MPLIAACRRAASLLATGLAAASLSGCMLISEATDLVSPGEAVEALPASFVLQTYNEADDGGFAISDDPGEFTLKDGGYVAYDGSVTAYFVPLDQDAAYLLFILSADGAMYGVARLRDDILELRVLFAGEPETELSAAGPVPAGTVFADGGVVVADRAGLDAVVRLIAEGKLTTTPLLAWVGEGTAPKRIVRDGTWYKGDES